MSMQLILNGNALDVLKDTEDECFNCVITSLGIERLRVGAYYMGEYKC